MSEFKTLFVLCGGQGSRFQEISTTKPKILAPVLGRPFIEILIQQAIDSGFKRMVFLLGHLSEPIVDFISKTTMSEHISLEFLIEKTILGTGGAVKNALEIYQKVEKIFLINGDTYWPDGLPIKASQNTDCIAVFLPNYQPDFGGITLKNDRAIKFNKNAVMGDYTSAGMLHAGRNMLLRLLQTRGSLENDFLPTWINENRPHYKIAKNTTDFGVPIRYKNVNTKISQDLK